MIDPDYNAMPVTDVIGHVLAKANGRGIHNELTERLTVIKDGIWLELPERRTALLCEVGRVINDLVPSKEDWRQSDSFWYDIRDIMNRCFGR